MSVSLDVVLERAGDLPVLAAMARLRAALEGDGAAVLAAPPGSGKTTAVPLALMDAPWLGSGTIVILEPRRIAARAAARRMAVLLGESVGERAGYQVRFDRQISARTRIEVVTEGILTRRLQRDPSLEGVGLVIFDEFHERSLDADLALALCLDARRGLREDLRLLVMSATLDTAPVARLLGDAQVIEAAGRPFPVEIRYQERKTDPAHAPLVSVIERALLAQPHDVLVFLPGAGEIARLASALADRSRVAEGGQPGGAFEVCPLYGDLSPEAQDRAISPALDGTRRVILATNIAESSLTIEGVGAVVDSGLVRRLRFDPNTGMSRLLTMPVARANADQRAGRAGRLGPGFCFRLWTETEDQHRAAHALPEIVSADLCGLVLELAAWGVQEPSELNWLDPPPAGAVAQAKELLVSLGALDVEGRITATGQRMAALPVHPRLARMLVGARETPAASMACDLAALLGSPDTLLHADRHSVDVLDRVQALFRWRDDRRAPVAARVCSQVDRAAKQLARAIDIRLQSKPPLGDPLDDIGALLLSAYPDRLAQRTDSGRGQFRTRGGRAVRLNAEDALAGEGTSWSFLIWMRPVAVAQRNRPVALSVPWRLAGQRLKRPLVLKFRKSSASDGRRAKTQLKR